MRAKFSQMELLMAVIFLGAGKSADDFYEITNEEYERIMAEQEKEIEV